MFAGLGRGAVAVAFEQPLAVVGGGELAHAAAELLEAGEPFDPEHLLFEGLDELLRAAVGLGLVVVGGRAGDPEVVDLDLVVLGAEAGPAVVAQREALPTAASTEPNRSTHTSLSRSAAAKRSIRSPASAHASPLTWSIITNTAQRPSSLKPSVASVAQSVSGTVTVIVPSCTLAARLRILPVGANSPASRVRRSTRLRLVRTPRRRRRAHTLR